VRFYLERLRLLLVPRLTAVLILVVLLMALVAVVATSLGIERRTVRGAVPDGDHDHDHRAHFGSLGRARPRLRDQGGGGFAGVASLAYLAMAQPQLRAPVFVFPELLLVLLAVTLLLGRYSGYRLSELFRFRALAREAEAMPIVPPPSPARGPRRRMPWAANLASDRASVCARSADRDRPAQCRVRAAATTRASSIRAWTTS
jgi:hypothetical protein